MSVTHSVSDTATLMTALRHAGTGDVILLAAGDYGTLVLKGQAGLDMTFAGGITIAAAGTAGAAVFTGLDLRGAANLTFDGITFDYRYTAGDPSWTRPFSITDSQNITITNAVFDGDVVSGVSAAVDGYANAYGLSVSDTQGFVLSNSTLSSFVRGVIISNSRDVTIRANDIADMRSDGLNIGGVQNIIVADNYIHDFRSSVDAGDHPDFIQIWTRGTTQPTTDVTISGNMLDIGDGTPAQSIFIRNDLVDRGLAGFEMYYRNITISDNVIVGAQSHGITVGETDGLVIANNTVAHADGGNDDGADAAIEIPVIRVSDRAVNVAITNNLTGGIVGPTDVGPETWTVGGNVIIQDQDPYAAGYYTDVFLASSLTTTGAHDFQVIPGSAAALTGAGASASYAGVADENGTFLIAQFQVRFDAANTALRIFDATSAGDVVESSGVGVTYHWDFGDGVTAVGAVVTHAYQGGGTYDVILTVSDGIGASTSAVSTVAIAGPDVLGMQADGRFITYDLGDASVLDGMGLGASGGIDLGAEGVTAQIARSHISDILSADEFAISFTLESASIGAAAGEVMRLHGSFLTQVTKAGEMVLYGVHPNKGT